MSNKNDCCLVHWKNECIRDALLNIQEARMKKMKYLKPKPVCKSPREKYEIKEMLEIPYKNREGMSLAMDIFVPVVQEKTELPAIVTIHGGGLVIGDLSISREHGKALARRGYLVFSLEYRLAPKANVCQQLDDVCAGMDLVGRKLVEFDVDFNRLFLSSGSAGAFLAIYVAAMKRSKELQKAIGYEPGRMVFKAMGLCCGMFYTDRDDPIGWILRNQLYGKKLEDESFSQYLNPEHEEIINNLPPVYLTTSRGDYLNRYTLMYHDALKKAGRKSHLVYYGDKNMPHDFMDKALHLPRTAEAIDRMCDWLEEQALEKIRYREQSEKN